MAYNTLMSDCLFCKLASGEIETDFLFENESYVAFKDLHPKANTHVLIVSKRHLPSLADATLEDRDFLGEALCVCKQVADKLGLPGYNVRLNVGKEGGQEIFHIHFHLMSNS